MRFDRPRTTVDTGVIATGSRQAGSVSVRAVPRSWERLPKPVELSWFPAHTLAQALVEPAAGTGRLETVCRAGGGRV